MKRNSIFQISPLSSIFLIFPIRKKKILVTIKLTYEYNYTTFIFEIISIKYLGYILDITMIKTRHRCYRNSPFFLFYILIRVITVSNRVH